MIKKLNSQTVGNVGMYYVCYHLSRLGWNVMPTARNAKGVDIIIYNQDASSTYTIQVKSLSKRTPVPLGSKLDNLFADWVVICRKIIDDSPECFILKPKEVKDIVDKNEKDGRISYWLQPKKYENEKFFNKWERIGTGF